MDGITSDAPDTVELTWIKVGQVTDITEARAASTSWSSAVWSGRNFCLYSSLRGPLDIAFGFPSRGKPTMLSAPIPDAKTPKTRPPECRPPCACGSGHADDRRDRQRISLQHAAHPSVPAPQDSANAGGGAAQSCSPRLRRTLNTPPAADPVPSRADALCHKTQFLCPEPP